MVNRVDRDIVILASCEHHWCNIQVLKYRLSKLFDISLNCIDWLMTFVYVPTFLDIIIGLLSLIHFLIILFKNSSFDKKNLNKCHFKTGSKAINLCKLWS